MKTISKTKRSDARESFEPLWSILFYSAIFSFIMALMVTNHDLADDTWDMTDGVVADGGGSQGEDGERLRPGDTNGPGGQGGTTVTSIRGGARVPED